MEAFNEERSELSAIRKRLELDLEDLKGINEKLTSDKANLIEQVDDQRFRLENERHEADKLRMDLTYKNSADANISKNMESLQSQLNREIANLEQYRK